MKKWEKEGGLADREDGTWVFKGVILRGEVVGHLLRKKYYEATRTQIPYLAQMGSEFKKRS